MCLFVMATRLQQVPEPSFSCARSRSMLGMQMMHQGMFVTDTLQQLALRWNMILLHL